MIWKNISRYNEDSVNDVLCDNLKKSPFFFITLGTSRSPERFSSRIVFLFILMLSLFLTTSYSAIIVSLLQTSSNAINSLTDLLDSSFKLSMREIDYNTKLVNVRSSSILVFTVLSISYCSSTLKCEIIAQTRY